MLEAFPVKDRRRYQLRRFRATSIWDRWHRRSVMKPRHISCYVARMTSGETGAYYLVIPSGAPISDRDRNRRIEFLLIAIRIEQIPLVWIWATRVVPGVLVGFCSREFGARKAVAIGEDLKHRPLLALIESRDVACIND